MANVLTSNPVFIDTASGSEVTNKAIKLIQWIDDNADLAANADLDFTLNGVTIHIKVTAAAVAGIGYQAGPFDPPIKCNSFVINTIDFGVVLLWCV